MKHLWRYIATKYLEYSISHFLAGAIEVRQQCSPATGAVTSALHSRLEERIAEHPACDR